MDELESEVDSEPTVTIIMSSVDGQPRAELLMNGEEVEDRRLAMDFLGLYNYLADPIFLAHIKHQFKLATDDMDSEAYAIFRKKLDEQNQKNINRAMKPFISPLDVFRRGK